MNEQKLEKKVCQDADKLKKDMSVLVGERAEKVSQFEDNVSQATDKAKDNLTEWMGSGVSHLGNEFDKLSDDTKAAMTNAASTVKKDIGHGLSQYNAKAQEVADEIPGGLGEIVAKYPWVAISIALAVGLVLGSMLKPQSLG